MFLECKKANKTNSLVFSWQEKYRDQATTVGLGMLVLTFSDRRVSHGQYCGSPRLLISVF
jgi:hypothetical protein